MEYVNIDVDAVERAQDTLENCRLGLEDDQLEVIATLAGRLQRRLEPILRYKHSHPAPPPVAIPGPRTGLVPEVVLDIGGPRSVSRLTKATGSVFDKAKNAILPKGLLKSVSHSKGMDPMYQHHSSGPTPLTPPYFAPPRSTSPATEAQNMARFRAFCNPNLYRPSSPGSTPSASRAPPAPHGWAPHGVPPSLLPQPRAPHSGSAAPDPSAQHRAIEQLAVLTTATGSVAQTFQSYQRAEHAYDEFNAEQHDAVASMLETARALSTSDNLVDSITDWQIDQFRVSVTSFFRNLTEGHRNNPTVVLLQDEIMDILSLFPA